MRAYSTLLPLSYLVHRDRSSPDLLVPQLLLPQHRHLLLHRLHRLLLLRPVIPMFLLLGPILLTPTGLPLPLLLHPLPLPLLPHLRVTALTIGLQLVVGRPLITIGLYGQRKVVRRAP